MGAKMEPKIVQTLFGALQNLTWAPKGRPEVPKGRPEASKEPFGSKSCGKSSKKGGLNPEIGW